MPALELILARNLLEAMGLAGFLLDQDGDLVYFNGRAEEQIGQRFEDGGSLRLDEWSSRFGPFDEFGAVLAPDRLPLTESLREGLPATARFHVKLGGERQEVEVIALPLGSPAEFRGAMIVFWAVSTP